jgi:hypothetical protein
MERLALVFVIGFAAVALAAPVRGDDLAIESVRVTGARIHLAVRNDGAEVSRPLSVALTTRAGGFMIGTAAHPLPALWPGARHEIELPLPIWAPDRPELMSVISQTGCCTTRVVLLPADVAVEVSHPLPRPNGGRTPPSKEESP